MSYEQFKDKTFSDYYNRLRNYFLALVAMMKKRGWTPGGKKISIKFRAPTYQTRAEENGNWTFW